jgi:hypothetical protein
MMCEVGVANGGPYLQSTVWEVFDFVQRQSIDVDQSRGSLDLEFHQVDEGRPAGDESNVGALLCGLGLGSCICRRSDILGSDKFEGMHRERSFLRLGTLANLLNRSNDVGVRTAPTDIAAHEFFDGGVVRSTRFFEQCDGGHDLARGAIPTLVSVGGKECGLHGMQCFGGSESFDGCDLISVVHHGETQA